MAARFQFSTGRLLIAVGGIAGILWMVRLMIAYHGMFVFGVCPCIGLLIGLALGRNVEGVLLGMACTTILLAAFLLAVLYPP